MTQTHRAAIRLLEMISDSGARLRNPHLGVFCEEFTVYGAKQLRKLADKEEALTNEGRD